MFLMTQVAYAPVPPRQPPSSAGPSAAPPYVDSQSAALNGDPTQNNAAPVNTPNVEPTITD